VDINAAVNSAHAGRPLRPQVWSSRRPANSISTASPGRELPLQPSGPLNVRFAESATGNLRSRPADSGMLVACIPRLQSLRCASRHAIERPVSKRGLDGREKLNQRFYERD